MIELICYCDNRFKVYPNRIKTAKYCSMLCGNREKARNNNIKGDNNPRWKGKKVGKSAMHGWMARNWRKSGICEHCNNHKKTDWANKTGKYIRGDRNDWLELCRSCHTTYDGKIKYIPKNHKRYNAIEPRPCTYCNTFFKRHAGHQEQKYCSRECYFSARFLPA